MSAEDQHPTMVEVQGPHARDQFASDSKIYNIDEEEAHASIQVQTLEMQRRLLAKTKTDKTNMLLKKSTFIYLSIEITVVDIIVLNKYRCL